jgi:hypothetical protein
MGRRKNFLEAKPQVYYWDWMAESRVPLTLKLLVHVPVTSQETNRNQHDGTEQTWI